jgi:hypothetical protein
MLAVTADLGMFVFLQCQRCAASVAVLVEFIPSDKLKGQARHSEKMIIHPAQ